nr:hypothetical protein [Tanacetum cinerariifolium]
MTRSSNKKLVTPYEKPKRVLRSARKLFKTTSLNYLSLPEFDLFFDLEDQCEEEVVGAIWEPTMEEYMTKTRDDYRSGFARPKIDEKAHFELKVFSMSLTGAASRWIRNEPAGLIDTWETLKKEFLSKYCPPAQTAKKMEEINNFQQEPDET